MGEIPMCNMAELVSFLFDVCKDIRRVGRVTSDVTMGMGSTQRVTGGLETFPHTGSFLLFSLFFLSAHTYFLPYPFLFVMLRFSWDCGVG